MFARKKRWLLLSVVVGLLTVGITAGAVLAHGGSGDGESKLDSFASRVASILGLEESQVQDAFTQAKEEAREAKQAAQEARLQDKLNQMAEEGSITQEQADQYMEWVRSKPEGMPPLRGIRGFSGQGLSGEHGFGGRMFGGRSFGGRLSGEGLFGHGWFGQNQGGESRSFQQAPNDSFSGIDQIGAY